MAITTKLNNQKFGVGDRVRVVQKIKEGDKERSQAFEGIVISIKGRAENASFTVRRIGSAQIGIERIFPVSAPSIESVSVVKEGRKGVKRSKLYYIRSKSRREIEKIYSRNVKKTNAKSPSKKQSPKKVSSQKRKARKSQKK